MGGTALQRLGLAGLARATQQSLNWRKWVQGARRRNAKVNPPQEVLDKLIESEIIPRLMLVNREAAQSVAPGVPETSRAYEFTAEEVDRFALRAVENDHALLVEEINTLIADGVPHDDVLLKLLAPAARRLGELWEDDRADFTEVTIGLMKLHRVLDQVRADAPCSMSAGASAPRILLAPAEGEQHIFGLMMVGELFARSGWRVRCETQEAGQDLTASVAQEKFDIVGLSASTQFSLKALRKQIDSLRNASCNPDVAIMVGGQLFNEDLGLARRVGADATATDGVRAVVTAERLVHRLARAEGAPQH